MYAESHSSGPDLASSLTMDYNSLISHDSDTLFSTDFNFSELDVFGFSNLENQDESQCDERLSPWMEPQNNSLDMNNGFDFMFSMVNPRSVMADMSNHTSIQRNMNFDTQTVANGSEVELISDNPEVSESTNWSIHQHHNESEPESDEDHDYEVTESEAENEKNEQQGVKNANHTSVNFKSTIVINNDTSQKKFSAPVETKKPIQMQKIRVDDVNIHNIQVVPNSNRMQQLRRQIYNNNMQARFIAEQQQQSTQSAVSTEIKLFNCSKISKLSEENLDRLCKGKCYPKPTYSYSCLIAMALKNSQTGLLPVSEIYKFMCDHFPYFKTAPNGWKNSVRHNLSLNKCFEKVEKLDSAGNHRKGCLWAINDARKQKMDEEMKKWSAKDRALILSSLVNPDFLEPLENGELKHLYGENTSEQLLSFSEAESNSTDELGNTIASESRNLSEKLRHFGQLTTTNFESQDESSQDYELESHKQEQQSQESNIDTEETLRLHLNVPSVQDSIPVFEINHATGNGASPFFEVNQPSSSPIYELSLPSDSSVYQLSASGDVHVNRPKPQTPNPNRPLELTTSSVYQFNNPLKTKSGYNDNNNSNHDNTSNNSNSSTGSSSPSYQDASQANSKADYYSNQEADCKRQKVITNKVLKNAESVPSLSVLETRRKTTINQKKTNFF